MFFMMDGLVVYRKYIMTGIKVAETVSGELCDWLPASRLILTIAGQNLFPCSFTAVFRLKLKCGE